VSLGSFVGVLAVLGFVLALLLLTLRLLKRYTPLGTDPFARIPLAVVQRLPLGPRQGIAIVRIGESFVAVSVGDGGIRHIADLPEGLAVDDPSTATAHRGSGLSDFRGTMRTALRATGLGLLFAVMSGVVGAQQQAPPTTPPKPSSLPSKPSIVPSRPSASAKTASGASSGVPAGVPPVARIDTMLTRLAPRIDLRVGNEQAGGIRLSGTVGVVVMMGLLTLLPTLVLMMTGFTRIFIVLQFLRQALGTQSAPPTQLVAALALLLTGFVMAPTLSEVNRTALEPWMDGKMEQSEMLAEGVKPFREFMLRQTRERDIAVFMELSRQPRASRADDVPLVVLASAFATSELRVAFQLGFALFLPFIVIDVVVASVLMSMGMMMLPPVMVSLPFKLLLFVLVDGWSLVVQGLVRSFH
jgi:flagellar biosynthetic protein FliP